MNKSVITDLIRHPVFLGFVPRRATEATRVRDNENRLEFLMNSVVTFAFPLFRACGSPEIFTPFLM